MQPPVNLGKLESVPLEIIWPHEEYNFTPWLAQPQNLQVLGDALGIDLEPDSQEVAVGDYSADILCKNSADGSWVLIENQIKKTDHRHLGQILTYAAGLGAKTMVWVAAKFTEEHRAALDWLNENTGENFSFFGLEIELWRIGNSPPAPKFNIVSKPNDWSKAVKGQAEAAEAGQISDHKKHQFEFFTAFKTYLEENTKLKPHKPGYQHWLNLSIGRSGFNLAVITSAWNSVTGLETPEVRVELQLKSSEAKEQFFALQAIKEKLQNQIDLPLTWHNPDQKKSCRIYVRRDGDFIERTNWDELFAWLAK